MTSDPIADMLTRIRNANTAKHDTVDIPASKIKVDILSLIHIYLHEVSEAESFLQSRTLYGPYQLHQDVLSRKS